MAYISVTQVKDSYAGGTTFTSTIKVEDIRCFYKRHQGPGTRITFRDGGGFAVLDSVDAIRDAITTRFPSLKFASLNQVRNSHGEGEGEAPVVVNVEAIRNFYPRHEGRVGTRLTFDDGGGFAVAETYDQVLQAVTDGSDLVVLPTPEVPQPLQLVHDSDQHDEDEEEEEDIDG